MHFNFSFNVPDGNMKMGILLIFCTLIFSQIALADEISDLSYGDIYLSQPERLVAKKIDWGLSYGAGFGVPEYSINALKLTGDYWLNEIFWVGANAEVDMALKSSLQSNVEQLLNQNGRGYSYERPTMALRAVAGIAPFSGLLNLFGRKVLPFELSLTAEGGIVQYKSETSPGPFRVINEMREQRLSLGLGIDQRIILVANQGIKFSFNQYFEGQSTLRTLVTIGWYGRF